MKCCDCIHETVCKATNSYLKMYPSGYLDSIEADEQCYHFTSKSDYIKADDVLAYVIRAKSCILTSDEANCEFYALLSILEQQLNRFRLKSSDL